MVVLTSEIKIGDYTLAALVSLTITTSWETLTDTMKLTLPSFITHEGKRVSLADAQLIKRGDPVSVKVGYDGVNETVFEGFVRMVRAGSPVVVECEDFAYTLKEGTQNLSFKSISLSELINQIAPDSINVVVDNVGLGQFRINNASPAKVLDEIKKAYGLKAFFRGNTLFVGRAYSVTPTQSKKFEFQQNIIKDKLEYKNQEDIKIKVRAVSMLPNNEKIETTVGDEDGEERTLTYYNLSLEDLKKAAEADIEGLRYSGYSGSFTAFGVPRVEHGDVVQITDDRHNRKGNYYVRKVVKTFGVSGYRQVITLDRLFE